MNMKKFTAYQWWSVESCQYPIIQCDEAITILIAELARKAERLKTIPGVGPVVAATMLAEMPELGSLTTQTAAGPRERGCLHLRAAGKEPLVAMTACRRKLVILMNRLLKNHDFYCRRFHRAKLSMTVQRPKHSQCNECDFDFELGHGGK